MSVRGASHSAEVDPFIGTANDSGQLFPGPYWPFGLVQLSPDTQGSGHQDAHAGYDYRDEQILGFSHTRVSGTGNRGAGGSVLVTPRLITSPDAPLEKVGEFAEPGYYRVETKNGLVAELTASERIGFHRYQFPAGENAALLDIDLTHSLNNGYVGSSLEVATDGTVSGLVEGRNVCPPDNNYRLYFALRAAGAATVVSQDANRSLRLRVALDQQHAVVVRVALSPIDARQAKAELDADEAGADFDQARQRIARVWARLFDRCRVDRPGAANEAQLRLFYTCLYRSFLMPSNVTASDGRYRSATDYEHVQKRDETQPFTYYSGWGTWDDYRKFALVGLLEPDRLGDIARSIVELFRHGPVPPAALGTWPSPTVRNEFMSAIVLEAMSKGLISADAVRPVYPALTAQKLENPLEQAYSDWVSMRLAERLGLRDEAERLRSSASAYRTFWVKEQKDEQGVVRGFFTPDGKPVERATVTTVDGHFYEGNLWHYRWWAPHDIAGLIELNGGRAAFVANLRHYFESDEHMALNEPPLAYPFLFTYAGHPWLTQYWSRHFTTDVVVQRYHNHGLFKRPVVRPVYLAQPEGWLPTMDDDTGAMSSHFVYSALGLFPACPGEPYYLIGSPLFEKVTLAVGPGREFVIEAKGTSDAARYVQSAMLNGVPLTRAWLWHREVAAGGRLELLMTDTPNRTWASSTDSAPPSLSDPPRQP